MRLVRKVFLGAGAAFTLSPQAVRAQARPKIRVGASAVGDIVVVLWAAQAGLFQKYGVDVDLQRMNSSAAIVAAVAGGALDVGKASLFGLVVARSKGIPIVLEAPSAMYTADKPDSALVVAQNSQIKSARDLNGKTLASASLGDLFTTVNAAWMDQNGGDSRTLKYLEMPGTAIAEAIVAGRVDGGTLADPILSEAVRSGKCRAIGYPMNVLGKRCVATAYFCAATFAAQNVAALAGFRKACDESAAYLDAHIADSIPLVAKFSGIDAKLVELPQLGRAAELRDPRYTQSTIDVAAKYNAITRRFPVRDMIDTNALSA